MVHYQTVLNCCNNFSQLLTTTTTRASSSSSSAVLNILTAVDSSWLSVLEAGSHLGYKNEEICLLFSRQKLVTEKRKKFASADSSIFLHSFLHDRFPFVQKLLSQSLKLSHPLKGISLPILNAASSSSRISSSERENFTNCHHYHYCISNLFLLPVGILFVSKFSENFFPQKSSQTNFLSPNIEEKQLWLCKASLMLQLSQRIHRSVRNTEQQQQQKQQHTNNNNNNNKMSLQQQQRQQQDKGNKIATLVGDLFITEMYNCLAKLGNNQVVNWMSETLADFSRENFPSSSSSSSSLNSNYDDDDDCQQPPPSLAIKILFANSFACAEILRLMKTTKENHDPSINEHLQLGYLIGNMYHVHENLLIFLHSLLLQEENVYFDEVKQAKISKQLETLHILHGTTTSLLERMSQRMGQEKKEIGIGVYKQFIILLDFLALKNIPL